MLIIVSREQCTEHSGGADCMKGLGSGPKKHDRVIPSDDLYAL